VRWFLANLLLALAWAAVTAGFTLANLAAGFVVGYLVLLVAQRLSPGTTYFGKVWQVLRFAGFYLWELVLSNLRVAYDVVTPGYRMRPAVVAVPLECRSEGEITLLANLITMTPGTLALDVSDDHSVLFVHAMFVRDPDELRRSIKEGLERRVLELLR
jgi:multicomponent Na+:H+ antiporter subunit E